MSRYIIKNCDLFNNFSEECLKDNGLCEFCTDCILKKIYEDVKTVYRTPEYFEELAKKGDKEQKLIESAWHNVAHMVISKLDIQEVE